MNNSYAKSHMGMLKELFASFRMFIYLLEGNVGIISSDLIPNIMSACFLKCWKGQFYTDLSHSGIMSNCPDL